MVLIPGLSPILTVFLVGSCISVGMSLINRKFLGAGKAKEVKDKMQGIRDKMLEAQKDGDKTKMNEHLSELMKINSEYMKFMFKPMIISIVVVILVLPFLRGAYEGMTVATVPEALPVIGGFELSWFWWYFVSTLVVSIVVRKLVGV